MKKDEHDCKHLNFVVRGHDHLGKGFCPDCRKLVNLSGCFNNLATEMRRMLDEAKEKEKR